ncbi:MAG TPA: hypothetical protein VL326_14635 [Kofleriaceae bacterium]|jgi:hypothetical protein|nr:hypothetical protein [Kofleriaceae bacterium]
MTAAVAYNSSSRPARTNPTFETSPFPSEAALRLEQTPMWELEKVFVRGATPDLESLVGWEFRGINHLPLNVLPVANLVGIKKFVKGFHRTEDGRVMGYNSPTKNNALDGRWHVAAKRFGFYEVDHVDPTSRDNKYLHAVLLDYGKGDNPTVDPSQLLRDYVVQVDRANPNLFLGKAYGAIGPLRIPTNFFILERFRVGLTDYAMR